MVKEFYAPSQIRTRFQCDVDSKSSLTEEERMQLIRTFAKEYNFYAYRKNINHWYNCRNGHLYYVGECGSPVVQTTCPDCGETIGIKNDDGSIRDKEDVTMKLTIQKLRLLQKRRESLDRKRKPYIQRNWMKLRSKKVLQPPMTV